MTDKPSAALLRNRARFNETTAPELVAKSGRCARMWQPIRGTRLSTRFCYFDHGETLTVVAGAQEGRPCDMALAYGSSRRSTSPAGSDVGFAGAGGRVLEALHCCLVHAD